MHVYTCGSLKYQQHIAITYKYGHLLCLWTVFQIIPATTFISCKFSELSWMASWVMKVYAKSFQEFGYVFQTGTCIHVM